MPTHVSTILLTNRMKNVFIDTNVLLDFFLNREGVGQARRILFQAFKGTCSLYVSSLAFSHLAYIMRKTARGKALYDILETLREMVNIVSVDDVVIDNAIKQQANDFEDAIQYFSAKKINADCIVTNNIKDFTFSQISVLSPKEFLVEFQI